MKLANWQWLCFSLILILVALGGYGLVNVITYKNRAYEASLLKQKNLDLAYKYFKPFAQKCKNDRQQWLFYAISHLETQKEARTLYVKFLACAPAISETDQMVIVSEMAKRLEKGGHKRPPDLIEAKIWRDFVVRHSSSD